MPDRDERKLIRPDKSKIGEAVVIKKLQSLVDEKDQLFEKTVKEKANLEAENLNLKSEIRQRSIEVKDFSNEKKLIEEKYIRMDEANKKLILKKDLEIRKLQEQLEKTPVYKDSDKELVKELVHTKIKFQEVNINNSIKMQELIDTKSQLEIKDERLRKSMREINNLNKIIADQQFETIEAKTKLDLAKNKIKKAFTSEELSGYLNSTIESFNSQVNTVDSAVNYIINEMDIDLKAQVYVDEQDGIMISSPDIASNREDGLSSIKLSIRAVPKL